MPTYDYECQTCGHKFELFLPITSGGAARCPKCGQEAKRLIGAGAGIIFKGSGFYETDYKRKPSCPVSKECGKCDGKDKTV